MRQSCCALDFSVGFIYKSIIEEEEWGKEEEKPKGGEEKKGREGMKVKVRRKEGR